MSQPSITCYFNARKRSAVEDTKLNSAKKVLRLDNNDFTSNSVCRSDKNFNKSDIDANKIVSNEIIKHKPVKKMVANRSKKLTTASNKSQDIQNIFNKMKVEADKVTETVVTEETLHVTPPNTPKNALDNVKEQSDGLSIKEIRRKMSRSARLADLKASLCRFQENATKLKEIEKKTAEIPESPKLKSFRTIELEVETSPQKVFSPEKQYLSPKKDLGARRNLFNVLSPTKNAVSLCLESPSKQILEETSKPALTLPYKYRYIAEIFRSVDIICQIMYNRKETITFKKLKPAVEEMLKRNLLEKHLGQIKTVYPDAYTFTQEKIKVFGAGLKQEKWEMVVVPQFGDIDHMNSEVLLQRRRKFFGILLDKVKVYHEEFLASLDPPIVLDKMKLTRWHPEFNIERVPDIECSELPQPPAEEKFITGQDVLEKAKQMFNCNTRMEQALQRLQEKKRNEPPVPEEKKPEEQPASVLKGIPKALLEKVRQRQAAKALLSMTRSEEQEKELKIYSRLPEIARLTRNLFVSEKKSVLLLDVVTEKLGNCYKGHLSKPEMEEHLRVISKEFPTWLVFHNIRNCVYLKIAKNDDLSLILHKLELLVKEKSGH